MVNDELGRKWTWPVLRYYPGKCMDVMKESTKACQNGWSPG